MTHCLRVKQAETTTLEPQCKMENRTIAFTRDIALDVFLPLRLLHSPVFPPDSTRSVLSVYFFCLVRRIFKLVESWTHHNSLGEKYTPACLVVVASPTKSNKNEFISGRENSTFWSIFSLRHKMLRSFTFRHICFIFIYLYFFLQCPKTWLAFSHLGPPGSGLSVILICDLAHCLPWLFLCIGQGPMTQVTYEGG